MKQALNILLTIAVVVIVALNILTVWNGVVEWLPRTTLYICELTIFGVCIVILPKFRIDRLLVAFCIIATASVIVNEIHPSHQSTERLLFFIVMLGLLSPLIQNALLLQLRKILWEITILLINVAIIISALVFIPHFIRTGSFYYSGLFGHPMLLGFISSVTLTSSIWALLNKKEIQDRLASKSKALATAISVAFVLSLLSSIAMICVAGSRAALLAAILAIITIAIMIRHRRRALMLLIGGTVVSSALALTFHETALNVMTYKTRIAHQHNSITYSRDQLWQARLDEFCESPIIGIGFANSTHSSSMFDEPNKEGIIISEPGSSWLSVLSNTGLLGFLIILLFNLRLFGRLTRFQGGRRIPPLAWSTLVNVPSGQRTQQRPSVKYEASRLLYIPLLVLLITHGFFEGWFLYAGSLHFLIYWLLTSRIYSISKRLR